MILVRVGLFCKYICNLRYQLLVLHTFSDFRNCMDIYIYIYVYIKKKLKNFFLSGGTIFHHKNNISVIMVQK